MGIPFSARYVLDGLCSALGCSETKFIPRRVSTRRRSNGVYELYRWDGTIRMLRKVDFTQVEMKFIKHIVDSYDKLYSQLSTRGVTHQYLQTAINSSVFDVAVSRFISSSRSHFLNIHTLIQYFKLLSYEKYEGEQVKIGCFVKSTSDASQDDFRIGETKFEMFPTEQKVRINQELIGDSAFLRYVNGIDSFYLCDTNLNIFAFLNIISNQNDSFKVLSGVSVEDYIKEDGGIHFYIGVTSSGDIEIIVNSEFRLLFRKGKWFFIDCNLLNTIVAPGFEGVEPWRIFYSMSKINKGAVVLVPNNVNWNPDELVVRHTSDENGIRASITEAVAGAGIDLLCKTGELLRILTTDGMTIFDKDFSRILDFNSIVNTGLADSETGGGGRTSAAIAGSIYGVSVKVSEDGPISIYKNQELFYRIG